jgi:hypothetical protein
VLAGVRLVLAARRITPADELAIDALLDRDFSLDVAIQTTSTDNEGEQRVPHDEALDQQRACRCNPA